MKILNLSLNNSSKIIKEVVQTIKNGGVIIFPTDTVYGLMANVTKKRAVDKIFRIKGRQKDKWLPVFIKDLKSAKRIAKIDKKQEKYLKSIWPGKTTAVFKRKKRIKLYGLDRETIALRIPKYELLNKLLFKVKKPLVQTSANISGKKSSNDIKEIIIQFKKHQPDLVISTGKLKSSKPSKVIDLTGFQRKILRK